MKRVIISLLVLLTLLIQVGCRKPAERASAVQKSPNIIFILTDDLGYGDVGVLFQNERAAAGKPSLRTPHLDEMARQGLLLTRHYVPAPVCAPSRASLMLGQHQGHANIRNNQFDKALADNHTIASVMKQAGYATGIVGKWGLQGLEGDSPATWEAYPTRRGFDYFLGYVRHRDGHNHYPAHKARERPAVELYQGQEEISKHLKGVYTADLFTAGAKKWIIEQKQKQPNQPFFLYLAYDTPHAGLQVPASPYPAGGGLKGGVQWKGEAGRFINTVSDTIDHYIHPDYASKDWPDEQKRHATMVRRIDDGVGDLIQLLKDLEIDEQTLIIFTSDNGPHTESYGYGPYKPTFFDSYGAMDGIKRDVWEGGIRVPTIVRWPGQVSANQRNDAPSGFHDWLPTFAQLAGVPTPANTDGVSLVPTLTGKGSQAPSTVYIEYQVNGQTPDFESFDPSHRGQAHGEMQVIYLDGYKGIRTNIKSGQDNFRIYDTRSDAKEWNDLSSSSTYYQELQKRMKEQVLRVRRPDTSAVRPYDQVAIPALKAEQASEGGLEYQVFEVSAPWVALPSSLGVPPKKSGRGKGMDLSVRTRDHDLVIQYQGLLEVPQTGEYTFTVQADGGAVLRLHDATVLDADKGYKSGSLLSSKVHLEKGYHPLRLIYAGGKHTKPSLTATWSGPGFSVQPLAFQRVGQPDSENRSGR
ncbi:sulfatase-like hydrolase/transferase [Telluribacter sp. SYSU D00476]|uniref:sulfatase-like hydrolase/transferase n=1 Tax=Telluribacter sp. SYSU D00476 TaxID=2811430 RepID=UPI001FF185DF|nr:sulfatase-like hydrolase/transferase [Telluribacter sp. SYSU D00476]